MKSKRQVRWRTSLRVVWLSNDPLSVFTAHNPSNTAQHEERSLGNLCLGSWPPHGALQQRGNTEVEGMGDLRLVNGGTQSVGAAAPLPTPVLLPGWETVILWNVYPLHFYAVELQRCFVLAACKRTGRLRSSSRISTALRTCQGGHTPVNDQKQAVQSKRLDDKAYMGKVGKNVRHWRVMQPGQGKAQADELRYSGLGDKLQARGARASKGGERGASGIR